MSRDEAASELAHRIAVARGDEPADLVLAGGKVLSVFTGELLDTDVAVAGEHVAGLGRYAGREVPDVSGLVLLPGFIDGHMHLESTKLMVDTFAAAALPCGTTAAVIDPHEIANVFGARGVHALLERCRPTSRSTTTSWCRRACRPARSSRAAPPWMPPTWPRCSPASPARSGWPR